MKSKMLNTSNLIAHIVIFCLLCKWWLNEKGFNYEAAIGVASYVFIIVNYINSQIINYPYLKYFVETHEKADVEKGFYTLVAVWSNSNKRIIKEDFLENRLPTLSLLSGYGSVEKVDVTQYREDQAFSLQKISENEFKLNMEYWDTEDFIILKFHHTKATFLRKLQVSNTEYQDLFLLDIYLKADGKIKEFKKELIDSDDFYVKSPVSSNTKIQLITWFIFDLIIIYNIITEIDFKLNYSHIMGIILFIIFSPLVTMPLLIIINSLFSQYFFSKKRKLLIEAFIKAGGKEYIEYWTI